jgi:hypothetical protein
VGFGSEMYESLNNYHSHLREQPPSTREAEGPRREAKRRNHGATLYAGSIRGAGWPLVRKLAAYAALPLSLLHSRCCTKSSLLTGVLSLRRPCALCSPLGQSGWAIFAWLPLLAAPPPHAVVMAACIVVIMLGVGSSFRGCAVSQRSPERLCGVHVFWPLFLRCSCARPPSPKAFGAYHP